MSINTGLTKERILYISSQVGTNPTDTTVMKTILEAQPPVVPESIARVLQAQCPNLGEDDNGTRRAVYDGIITAITTTQNPFEVGTNLELTTFKESTRPIHITPEGHPHESLRAYNGGATGRTYYDGNRVEEHGGPASPLN
ncbi:MAG: hypothetical protein Q8P57_01635 [Candidatus Pacearchaeota archaeon]|nr:hypothetical protein [Candidatus Pacearchaeota archaeon]